VLLLVVLQCVAPTWHICSMGGATCHEHEGRQQCHLPVTEGAAVQPASHYGDESAPHSHAKSHSHTTPHSHTAESSHPETHSQSGVQSHCNEPTGCKCRSGADAASLSNNVLQAPHDNSSENCLARLLMGLPGSVASLFAFTTSDSFYLALEPTVPVLRSMARLRQPPARGPPAISFL
jgi:hypothetical protein